MTGGTGRPGASARPGVTRAALADHVRETLFAAPPGRGVRDCIGAEVEFIPVRADGGERVLIDEGSPSSLDLLRAAASSHHWHESPCPGGGSVFRTPEQGTITFEPGGQIEYSSPPCADARSLIAHLEAATALLGRIADDHGITLLSTGVDPVTPTDRVPLQLHSPRYARMARHLATIGCWGAVMMRQSASLQLNFDLGEDGMTRWRVLNAASPYLIAILAGSPILERKVTGHQSIRAHAWRELDPRRTGVFAPDEEPAAAYLEFALDAPMLLAAGTDEFPAARDRLAEGRLTIDEWGMHLTTLFPEVRPRGWLELRSVDAIDPAWHPAVIALGCGLLHHPPTLAAADALLEGADEALLRRGGNGGMHDPGIAAVARDLAALALEGCCALESHTADSIGGRNVEIAAEYLRRYTARDRAPASDAIDAAAARGESAA